MGADLVVVRPYSARLLIHQLRALSRRSRGSHLLSMPPLTYGSITLDPANRTAQVADGAPRHLTQLEFRLLHTLMLHQGQTLTTEAIVDRVWGYSADGNLELVRGLVSRLRAKIEEEPKNPLYIITVPGVGYRLNTL
jgi:DNA-binding response OmpR family regulator